MKLSPAFLAYKLSSAFSVLAPENLPLSGTLELPVLYQTGSAATAHRVFLCTEEHVYIYFWIVGSFVRPRM